VSDHFFSRHSNPGKYCIILVRIFELAKSVPDEATKPRGPKQTKEGENAAWKQTKNCFCEIFGWREPRFFQDRTVNATVSKLDQFNVALVGFDDGLYPSTPRWCGVY
jgi:hypothetical protein